MPGLMIGTDSRMATLDEVEAIKTPERTRTHFPIPHTRLLEEVTGALGKIGLEIESAQYALRNGKIDERAIPGAQFFALLNLRNGSDHPDYSLIAGLRNAHDKASSARLALGSSVFVCTNMCFSGEVGMGRKHSRFILRDLPRLVHEAIQELPRMKENQEARIEAYKGTKVNDNWARCAIMRSAEEGLLAWNKAGKVWTEWQEPRHEEFKPRNAWSLLNGFTEVMKAYPIHDIPRRTIGLQGLLDVACKVQLN